MKEFLLLFSLTTFSFCFMYSVLVIIFKQNVNRKNKINFDNFIEKKTTFIVIVMFIILFFLLKNIIFSLILCILYIYFSWYIKYIRQQKVDNLVDVQILEALTIIKNSLQSGRSIINAVIDAKKELKEPLRCEFDQISKSLALGLSFDEAIEKISSKTKNKEFRFMLNTLKISKNTGASLKDIFDQIIEIVSKRIATKSKINALTSQGKLSGNIVSIIPFGIIFMMYIIEPDMMQPLFVTLVGNILLLIVVIMVISGSLIVRKMTEIDF